ncbi:MAG: hypothetical protein ACRDXB_12360, partial [Actinomycetes bacterium]
MRRPRERFSLAVRPHHERGRGRWNTIDPGQTHEHAGGQALWMRADLATAAHGRARSACPA